MDFHSTPVKLLLRFANTDLMLIIAVLTVLLLVFHVYWRPGTALRQRPSTRFKVHAVNTSLADNVCTYLSFVLTLTRARKHTSTISCGSSLFTAFAIYTRCMWSRQEELGGARRSLGALRKGS